MSQVKNPYDTSWTGKKSVNLRDYTNLYVSNNVDDPIGDTIKLGYTSEYDSIRLVADQYTFFHFPLKEVSGGTEGSENKYMDISGTTLINDGAAYGDCPYKSDRIYKLKNEYEDTTYYGRACPSYLNNGKWLCAWLSGDVIGDEEPKWMDRWFDPKQITEEAAALAESGNGKSVFDEESKMTFDYGAYYKYWRVGNGTISQINDVISFSGARLPLRLNDWWEDYLFSVSADDENKKFVYLNPTETSFDTERVSCDFDNDYAVSFNGDNQLLRFHNLVGSNRITSGEYSIVFWCKCEDWANAASYAFADNMYSGGWRFGSINHAMDPFICFYGNNLENSLEDGTICVLNSNADLVSTKAFWKTDTELHNIKDILIDMDNYVYVLIGDDSKSVISKNDCYGNRLMMIQIEAKLDYLDMAGIGPEFCIYAYSVGEGATVYSINRDSFEYSVVDSAGVSSSPADGYVEIGDDYYSYDPTKGWFFFSDIVVEGAEPISESLWFYSSLNLEHETDDPIKSIACDFENNAWVLRNDRVEKYSILYAKYQKVDEFKIKSGINPISINVMERPSNGKNVEVILVCSEDRQAVYMYSKDGEYIQSNDTSRFYVRPGNLRRMTAYDWYRMHRSFTECVFFDIVDSKGHNCVTVPHSEVSETDWNQFAVIVKRKEDENQYSVEFYLNCRLIAELQIEGKDDMSTFYKYASPIVLGGMSGKMKSLPEEINITNKSFRCSIDDFRIYSYPISLKDLYYIKAVKHTCVDLVWNFTIDARNFVENVERVYKFKMPGSKSAHYVLHIRGFKFAEGASEEDKNNIKGLMEMQIRTAFAKTVPAHCDLIEIVWD